MQKQENSHKVKSDLEFADEILNRPPLPPIKFVVPPKYSGPKKPSMAGGFVASPTKPKRRRRA
jgi:hypothetical protein